MLKRLVRLDTRPALFDNDPLTDRVVEVVVLIEGAEPHRVHGLFSLQNAHVLRIHLACGKLFKVFGLFVRAPISSINTLVNRVILIKLRIACNLSQIRTVLKILQTFFHS